ncbi:sodium:solute symporter family protein [Ornithinimicrobium sediminis]|uniref:sodium:solute symporter family protein n=1 Tax=Ornithinimicrobium sediminis TaxID=2904603 RepID=UPI001E3772BF|nr:sodium/solute symporter [Ornithinimicrobium sediminis]MCE0485464.1 sodium/solute symporter [Ornithinimicrobium sediminis]
MTETLVIGAYLVLTLGLGYLGLRLTRNDQDFYIAGGKLGWAVGGASIAATQMSSGLFIGTIGVIYAVGWSFAWVVFVFPLAYWLMVAVIAPRFTRERKVSLPDFIATRYYSSAARVIAAIIILIAFVVYISAQVIAGGLIGNALFGIPVQTGMIGFMLIVLAYTAIGGMVAVVYTDFLQMMIMIAGAALAIPIVLSHTGGFGSMLTLVDSAAPITFTWEGIAPSLLITLGLAFFLGAVARPEQLVRFYAMKDMATIRKGVGFVIVLVGVAHSLVFILALGTRVLFPSLSTGDSAMPVLAVNALPLFLGTLLLVAVASAMMSTISSVLLVAGTALSHDIYGTVRPHSSPARRLMIGRIGTVVVGLVPLAMVLSGFGAGELVQFIVALFSALMGAVFLVPVVAGVLWRRATREGAITSMVGGLLGTVGWRLFGDTATIDPVVPGFLASLGLMIVVSLLTPAPPLAATAPFFDTPTDARPAATERTETGVSNE